ncbi:hypothetical protein ACHAXS_004665 [Conticribra weissflogii]
MDDVVNELREAIRQVISLRGNETYQIEGRAEFSESTYVSSLSGSLPSDKSSSSEAARRKLFARAAHSKSDHHGDGGLGHYRSAASRIKTAVENYEVAIFEFCSEAVPSWIDIPTDQNRNNGSIALGKDPNQSDIVELLVTVMTSVPRYLYRDRQQRTIGDERDGGRDVSNAHLAAIEQICYDAACISSEILMRHFLNDVIIYHSSDLLDEVVAICENFQSLKGWTYLEPIVKLLNFCADETSNPQQKDKGDKNGNIEYQQDSIFATLPAKQALRLIQIIIHHFVLENGEQSIHQLMMARGMTTICGDDPSSHVGLFTGHLFEYFVEMASKDMKIFAVENNSGLSLFEAWADGTDEYMVQRLNDDDARDIPALIAQYHFVVVETASEIVENTGRMIESALSEDVGSEALTRETFDGVLCAIKETIRRVVMVVTASESMEKLGLPCAQGVDLIFNPLLVSYSSFVSSYLHDSLLVLRQQWSSDDESVGISNLADDLLLRMCGTSNGTDFLRNEEPGFERDEVITIALLRAITYEGFSQKAQFLVDIASDRAQVTVQEKILPKNDEPVSKRQRFNSLDIAASVQKFQLAKDELALANRKVSQHKEKLSDVLITCLALSRNSSDDELDESNLSKLSTFAASMLCRNDDTESNNNKRTISTMDPLNPWHTIQMESLKKKVADDVEMQLEGGDDHNLSVSLSLYVSAVPCFYDTTMSKVTV